MKRFASLLLLAFLVKVYSGGTLIGTYRIAHPRDLGWTQQNKYIITCIDKPRNCEVTIIGPAVLVYEEEDNRRQ